MTTREIGVKLTGEDEALKAKLADAQKYLDKLKEKAGRLGELHIDDADFKVKLKSAEMGLDRLGKKVASPRINLQGADRAELSALKLEATLDRVSRKYDVKLNETVNGSLFSRLGSHLSTSAKLSRGLFSGKQSAQMLKNLFKSDTPLTSNLPESGGLADAIASPGGAGIIAWLSSMLPALAGGAADLGIGGVGAAGAFHFDKTAFTAPLKSLDASMKSVFKPLGPIFAGILSQVASFTKTISPELRDMFKVAAPGVAQFVRAAEPAIKQVLPALTNMLNTLAKSGAMKELGQAFGLLTVDAVKLFTKMQGGFKTSASIVKISIGAIGAVFDDLAKFIGTNVRITGQWVNLFSDLVHGKWSNAWSDLKAIAGSGLSLLNTLLDGHLKTFEGWFDDFRHDVAAIWDSTWSHIQTLAKTGTDLITNNLDSWRHNLASIFDNIRHDIASVWDAVWQNTIGRLHAGSGQVTAGFHALWEDVWNVVRHWPGELYNLAKNALLELLHGAESMGHTVIGWFKGLGHDILGALHGLFSFGSPSKTMFKYGRWIVQGLHNGMKSELGSLKGLSGHIGGSVVGWIKSALAATHKPMSWLPALEHLVSLESGGNPRAVDPIPVAGGQHAEGLFQTIPSTFAAYGMGGSIFNPIADAIAGIRYIASQYGSPYNIPGLFNGGYKGYSQGGWITEPVLGVGMRSGGYYGIAENGPEHVGQVGGGNIYVTVAGDTNPDAAALRIVQLLNKYAMHKGGRTGIIGTR